MGISASEAMSDLRKAKLYQDSHDPSVVERAQSTPQLMVEIDSLHEMVNNLENTVQDLFNRLSILTQEEEVSNPVDESAIAKSGFPVSPAVRDLQKLRRDLVALNSAIQNRMSLLDI